MFAFEPGAVIFKVFANGAKDQRTVTQQRQGIGNVGGGAAALADHRIDQEGEGNAVQPFLQDVILEVTGEGHQIVVGN